MKPTNKTHDQLFAPIEHTATDKKHDEKKKMLSELYSLKNIEMKTELTARQIKALTKLQLFGQIFKNKLAKNLSKKFMVLQVSHKRKGRSEYSDIAKSFLNENNEMEHIQRQLLGG